MSSFDRVRLEGVTKVYGRQRVLGGIDLELGAGRICALLGPNGAGKSTLVAILSTLARPTGGQILYGDQPHDEAAHSMRGSIGLVAHEAFLYADLTGRENLTFYSRLYGQSGREAALLERVGLTAAADRPIRVYSRGMLQRLAIARALVGDPQLLLLDEPFAGLDRSGIEVLRRLLEDLRSEGRILLVVTHDLAAMDGLACHVAILRRGKIVHDETRSAPFARLEEIYAAHA